MKKEVSMFRYCCSECGTDFKITNEFGEDCISFCPYCGTSRDDMGDDAFDGIFKYEVREIDDIPCENNSEPTTNEQEILNVLQNNLKIELSRQYLFGDRNDIKVSLKLLVDGEEIEIDSDAVSID